MGVESTCAGYTYQMLASRLSAEGFAVARVDYEGTGDSSGSGDAPDQVRRWKSSVASAVDFLRDAGAGPVSAIGMRLGATILTNVAEECRFDALVLWDPCDSGKSFLREQRVLRAMRLEGLEEVDAGPGRRTDGDPGAVEVLGDLFSGPAVEEMSSLSVVASKGPLARRVLCLTRPDRPFARTTSQRLSMAHVEWAQATGQDELIGVPPGSSQVPEVTVDSIVRWLDLVSANARKAFTFPRIARDAVVQTRDTSVTEEVLRMGELGIFGILSSPSSAPDLPAIVMFNAGVIDHVGPGRLWVHLARVWAGLGFRCLRVDLSGLGDSPERAGQERGVMYPPEFFDDLDEITKAVSPSDRSATILVGLCSGGYHAMEGALSSGARGVLLINPIFPRNPRNQPGRVLAPRPPDPRRQAVVARKTWVRRLPAHDALASLGERSPAAAWWLFNRIGAELPPARVLERLVGRGVDTFVVAGTREAWVMSRGEKAALRRLGVTHNFSLNVIHGLDHELFRRSARDRVEGELTEHLTERFLAATKRLPSPLAE
jgi:alpha-beta hydrolase superfamily lysophospholipase